MSQPARYRDALTGRALPAAPTGNPLRVGDGTAEEYLVGPALFDPQVNGFAGVDFQDPELDSARLAQAVDGIRRAGCSHILLTLITQRIDRLEAQLARVAASLEGEPSLSETILGIHLEGPFLSPADGYHGAHPREHLLDPEWSIFQTLQRASGNRIRMVTVAPERPGAIPLIRRATAEGVWVALGHTEASSADLHEAVRAGATIATHLGNGCPAVLPRHDNVIQRILAVPELIATVIPDLMHVPPPALENLCRCLGPDRLAFTTDSISAAAAPPGRHRLGDLVLDVEIDGVARLPGSKQFAGSSLRMVDGLRNAGQRGGVGIPAAWRGWTFLRELIFPEIDPPRLLVPASELSGALR